jgi:hypothetical protein
VEEVLAAKVQLQVDVRSERPPGDDFMNQFRTGKT